MPNSSENVDKINFTQEEILPVDQMEKIGDTVEQDIIKQELLGKMGDELWQKPRDNPYEKVCVVEHTKKIKRIIHRPTLRNKIPTDQNGQTEVKLGKQSIHSPFIKCHNCFKLGHIKRRCPDLVGEQNLILTP